MEEPLDRREEHGLLRSAPGFVGASPHKEPHERVQLPLLPQEQRFLLEPLAEPLEPEWLWAARSFLLAWTACEAQELRPCPCSLSRRVPELPQEDRLHCERLEQEVHLVCDPKEEALELLALRPSRSLVEPLE